MTNNNSTYKRLGDYIREVDVRNSDLRVSKLVGLTIAKAFIPSVANTIGTDLSKYKIIKENQFACSLMQVSRDGKMPIAIYKGEDAIMSPAYPVFEVCKDGLLPDYLQMWFSRSEFDREAVFYAVGGVRGSLEWNDFMDMQLPVPSIEEQRSIVNRYKAIENRIANNKQTIAKLEEAAQAVYRKMFVDDIDVENLPEGWRMGCLTDLGEVVGGATPSTAEKLYWVDNGIKWLSPMDLSHSGLHFIFDSKKHITQEAYNSCSTKMLPAFSVLFSSRAPIGLTAISTCEMCTNQGFKSIVPKKEIQYPFVYFTLLNEREKMDSENSGSTFNEVSTKYMEAYKVVVPDLSSIKLFNKSVLPLFNHICNVEKEYIRLTELLSMVMA